MRAIKATKSVELNLILLVSFAGNSVKQLNHWKKRFQSFTQPGIQNAIVIITNYAVWLFDLTIIAEKCVSRIEIPFYVVKKFKINNSQFYQNTFWLLKNEFREFHSAKIKFSRISFSQVCLNAFWSEKKWFSRVSRNKICRKEFI